MNITKSFVDKLTIPPIEKPGQTNQKRYYDNKLRGFGLRVTSGGSKTFFIEKRMNHKLHRISLGQYGQLTVEEARKQAQKMLGKMVQGIDPLAEKQAAKVCVVTLQDVFNDYVEARKALKPRTVRDYEYLIKFAFADWQMKPIVSITGDDVTKQHKKLGEKNGEAFANHAMRLLRALFNFAITKYKNKYKDVEGRSFILENPVVALSETRAWYRVEPRETFIKSYELKAWYQEIISLPNETMRDYLLFILLTGLRRQEAATLTWEQVDLKARTLTLFDTKNRKNFTLPLSNQLFALLLNRQQKNPSHYVFPRKDNTSHIVEPRKQMAKVIQATGIRFTVHDLRRTFITIAESLDISVYSLKRLLNHKIKNDVTAGYIIIDVERLRKPVQLIADHIFNCFTSEELIEPGCI